MSLTSTMLDFVSYLTEIYKEPGVSKNSSKYKVNKSLLNGVDMDSLDPSSPLISFFGQNKRQIREDLKQFHLTKAIIDLYSSTIMDSINSSSLKISNAREGQNKLNDKIIDDVNYFMDMIDIKTFIRQNINDFLYFGKFALIFKVKRQERSFIYNTPKYPHDFYLVECKDDDYLVLKNKKDQLVQRNAKNFVYYFNEKRRVDLIPGLDCDEDVNYNDQDIEDEDFLEDLISKVEYYSADGLLDDNLNLLLSIYLNETLLDNLSLRDATRKDIIIADVKDPKTPRTDVSSAMDDFNETFNNNFLYNSAVSSLQAMTALLMNNVIYEGTAVLPGHENYTNFDMLEIPDLSKKKEDLADLQISQRNKIFTNKGIPEGIFEGTGNKWDTLQDQSRFLTEVSKYNDSVIDFITSFALKYINEAYGLDITKADINLELGVSNTITNSKWNRDIGLQAKMLSEVSSILNTARNDTDVENLYIDQEKYLTMVNASLGVVNPSLENLILIEKTVQPSNERQDNDESEEGSSGNNQPNNQTSEIIEEQNTRTIEEKEDRIEERFEKYQEKEEKQKEQIESLTEKYNEIKQKENE